MTDIVYKGPFDVRVLDADDLKKAGVEGFRKTYFEAGKVTEVSEEAFTALTENSGLFGAFSAPADLNKKEQAALFDTNEDLQIATSFPQEGDSTTTTTSAKGGTTTNGASTKTSRR